MPPKFKRPTIPTAAKAENKTSELDDDTFFSRNTKGWDGVDLKALTSPTREKRRSSSPEHEYISLPKKRKIKAKKAPDWMDPDAVITLDDSDEAVEHFINDSEESKPRAQAKQDKGKGRAPRPRKRSITPPPEVSATKLIAAYQAANKLFENMEPSNITSNSHRDEDKDEDEEPIEALDEETLAIIDKAKQLASIKSPELEAQSPVYAGGSSFHPDEEELETDSLKLYVFWKGPPREDFPQKWRFQFNLTAPFRRLNEMMQQKTQLPEEDIVLVYASKRILLGATPRSLRMRKDTTEMIDVWPRHEWEEANSATKLQPVVANSVDEDDDDIVEIMPPTLPTAPQAQPSSHEPADKIVLNMRCKKYPTPVSIEAKRTATSSRLLARYLTTVGEDPAEFDIEGIARSRKPRLRLSFDGEELQPDDQIGSTDAEDEDVWDVIGL
ncbi:hypothetical protein PIIN_07847 [Serendipita indica DSM 11827]|uniref:Rad60/SUMO-like domain-containing protein n=1 Tax=Serendipita indica (strain DSM 11827) TaxID=1109443 RepID=G4TRF1_SERID|nr:hypothetical protein PIIN_07847 [Serendipita indica DSM 11827]